MWLFDLHIGKGLDMEYILKSVSGQSGNTRIIWARSTIRQQQEKLLKTKRKGAKLKNWQWKWVRRDPIYEKKLWPMQPYIRVTKGNQSSRFSRARPSKLTCTSVELVSSHQYVGKIWQHISTHTMLRVEKVINLTVNLLLRLKKILMHILGLIIRLNNLKVFHVTNAIIKQFSRTTY